MGCRLAGRAGWQASGVRARRLLVHAMPPRHPPALGACCFCWLPATHSASTRCSPARPSALADRSKQPEQPSLVERLVASVQRVREEAELRRNEARDGLAALRGTSPAEAELAELEAKGVVQASIDVVQAGTGWAAEGGGGGGGWGAGRRLLFCS